MLYYNQYVRAESLDEAYTLYQKKNNFILAGMLWQKMRNRTMGTAIDLCALGLDQVEETETEFRIGAYVSLRELETNERLNVYTEGAFRESVRHIVGVQFRNVATVGGIPHGGRTACRARPVSAGHSPRQGSAPRWRAHPERACTDRKSTRLNSSHIPLSRMPSSA